MNISHEHVCLCSSCMILYRYEFNNSLEPLIQALATEENSHSLPQDGVISALMETNTFNLE